MNNAIITFRYAKALFLVGSDNKCLDELKTDMEVLYTTCKDNPMFVQILNNPIIKPSQKRKAMHEILDKKVHPMTLNFVDMIVRNRRETMLPEVAHRFMSMYDESKGIKHAHVVSAVSLDDDSKDKLLQRLGMLFKGDIRLTVETNPDLIGGFVLRLDDIQYDASVSTNLKRIKKVMAVDN